MTRMNKRLHFLGLVVLIAAGVSCGDVVRQGRSPVMLVIDSLQAAQGNHAATFAGHLLSDVITNVTTGGTCTVAAPCPTFFNDEGQVILHSVPKDIAIAPTSNNAITISHVHVEYTRADGHNAQGQDVPYAFDGAVTGTVPPAGTATFSFLLVRNVAKEEPPLIQLQSSSNVITTIATVTFYGTDTVGNDVTVVGHIQVDFANFGDT
jgi:hypothetical protein